MAETILEKDSMSRKRIVSETDRNFFVEAGAGSGKTTMLVNRMVAMVEQGKDISKICAITFTKAAAGEFYERFQKVLIERSSPDYKWEDKKRAGQLPEPTAETRERCRKALENIDLCFMGTIDSFCSMVLSEHPSSADIPSNSAIVSDADAFALYKQIFVEVCAGKHESELASLSRVFRIFHRNPEEVFVRGIKLLIDNRNVHFNFSECTGADIDAIFEDDIKKIRKAVKCLVKDPGIKYTKAKTSTAAWEKIKSNAKTLSKSWGSDIEGVSYALKNLAKMRVETCAADKYGKDLCDVFVPGGAKGGWLEADSEYLKSITEKIKSLKYNISMTFLTRCIQVIENTMRDKGMLTFFDCLYYLRNMLKADAAKDGRLIRYIYDRHSYFLIDEFQDTNPMQAEIFFYISSENPVVQWRDCVPRQGSLFIVGDPKQSIYRFRSADVTSFLSVKKLFEAGVGDVLYLSRNFRSVKPLCEYFNRVFSSALPEETENQSRFEEIPLPEKDSDDFNGVFTYTSYTDNMAADHPMETDPIKIGEIIKTLVDNEKYKVTENGISRKLEYRDIMVISVGKKALLPIMQQLDILGIPTRTEGRVPFETNSALLSVYNIYRSVAVTGDRQALYSALTGSIFGHTKEDIAAFRLNGGRLSYFSSGIDETCTDERALSVHKSLVAIGEISAKSATLSPAALFSLITDSLEIYKFVSCDNMEVICYTLELLRNAEKSGLILSLSDGAAYLGELVSGNSEEERCLSLSDNENCVHMANLHKVKGLEAPVVILAAAVTPKMQQSADFRTEHGIGGSEGWVFNVKGEQRANGSKESCFETNEFDEKKAEENESLAAEKLRLDYVAATRARNALIICKSITLRDRKEQMITSWQPLLEDDIKDFFYVCEKHEVTTASHSNKCEADSLYKKSAGECVFLDRKGEAPSYSQKTPSHLKSPSKLDDESITSETEETGEETASTEKSGAHKYPQLLGTMTHRLMEILVSSKNRFSTEEAVITVVQEYCMQQSVSVISEIADALKKAGDTMKNGGYAQKNSAPQDILSVLLSAEECCLEAPFCYKEDDDVVTGIMDVIYKKDGVWHIIDYKTNADGSELDKKYQLQLNAYKKVLFEITGETAVDALTYHIDI